MLCLGIDSGQEVRPRYWIRENHCFRAKALKRRLVYGTAHCEPAPETWIEPDKLNHAFYTELSGRQTDFRWKLAADGYL
jgi:hypothetical protein